MKFQKRIFQYGLLALAVLSFSQVMGKENIGQKRSSNKGLRTAASCAPSSSSEELDVNNIRCLLHNGGDFWWDLQSNPRYEVPKVSDPALARHSSFAGSLWIGGVDESGQLRVAAQTYRQTGNDFWAGPLTANGASVDDVTCEQWDKHYKIEKAEILAFQSAYSSFLAGGAAINLDDFPAVKSWPAFGEDADGNRLALAPFVDKDDDPFSYNPEAGDYPDIAPFPGGGEPDQAIWWVINDKGDIHTETGGEAIGIEIQMLAFAFSTSNAINDMTFYKYKVINKSTLSLNETYMGQWVDADIGNFADDYVGCDTSRGLGFAYNGDADDDGSNGYGLNPPSLGVDFFQGPVGDDGNRLPMQRFVYYENDFSLRGNPEVATHFYGYLRGFWKDGSRMVDNGSNGFPATAPGPVTDFMYPGDPGFCGGTGTGWSEVSANNQPFDRRFLQSAGPFTLQPGAVNDIITGAVWARGNTNDNLGSVCELLAADDVAQALFNARFQLLEGPDAPELAVQEYNQRLNITWSYPEVKKDIYNNYNEQYCQADPVLASTPGVSDSLFKFQGYIVYQLKDGSVAANDVFDTDKARIIAQCDIKDAVSTIVNRTQQSVPGVTTPVIVDEIMVQGANEGIFNSISVTEDLFAETSDRRLKNYTSYYYGVLAYAYNDINSDGRSFVQGNRFFGNYSAMPHPISFENFGTEIFTEYGDGLEITQISGVMNGGNYVELSAATETAILNSDSVGSITYVRGKAPVTVKVINPKEILDGNYRLEVVLDSFQGTLDTIVWDDGANYIIDSTYYEWLLYESGSVVGVSTYIKRTSTGAYLDADQFRPVPLSGIERIVEGHGISVAVQDAEDPGDTLVNGFIGSDLSFEDPLKPWLSGLGDNDGFPIWNWILCGNSEDPKDRGNGNSGIPLKTDKVYDREENFEGILGGTFAPFCMVRSFTNGDPDGAIRPGIQLNQNPAGSIGSDEIINLSQLMDIDLVMTSDITKWSECVVVETASDFTLGSGAWPMSARWEYPISNPQDTDVNTAGDLAVVQGRSFFPGYAIDVNTGRRLNIFFGENSWDRINNGDDMLFNPTNDFGGDATSVGGRHFVYITDLTYDGCASLYENLKNGPATKYTSPSPSGSALFLDFSFNTDDSLTDMREVYKHVAWAGVPMLDRNYDFSTPQEIPTDARVQIRVNKPISSRGGTQDIPIFTFNTSAIASQFNVQATAETALDEIRVVPNPYYAYSRYENSQLQTIVKLTNLPQQCQIRIYTLNGNLIRTYIKDSNDPEQRWDLKNADGVPVASGVYIIHVDAGELGEKVVKFFAAMPTIDLNAF